MHEENFERELDGALAKYAAAEPREGLEQRVLATLRAQGSHAGRVAWRRWVAAGFAVASLAGLAIWVGGRSAVVNIRPVAIHQQIPSAGDSASNSGPATDLNIEETQGQSRKKPMKSTRRRDKEIARASVEVVPKLAQFPAPEPLTEEEKLLIQFVGQDPEGAALFAEVRARELQRESDQMNPLSDEKDLQQ